MEDFFNTIYGWTRTCYSEELDDYLYETVHGYLHNGIIMLISTIVFFVLFYYVFKPVRRQNFWWFMYFVFDAIVVIGFAIYYTLTPLVNNEIASEKEWSKLDCFFFGFTDILWAFVVYIILALLFKWWSPCKYVPFRLF